MVRCGHGNNRPRQARDALLRVTLCDLHPRRQQHAHVEAARRMAHEVQLTRPEAAVADDLTTQHVGAPRDRGGRLRHAPHDACINAAPTQRRAERTLNVLEIVHRADGAEAEEARHQEHQSFRHDRRAYGKYGPGASVRGRPRDTVGAGLSLQMAGASVDVGQPMISLCSLSHRPRRALRLT